jgi:non-canonical (house-cleaning) NTP pyrophosphatase
MIFAAVPLGLLACLSIAGSACCQTVPIERHHRSHHQPKEAPDQPAGCHATTSCAEHRRLRAFP